MNLLGESVSSVTVGELAPRLSRNTPLRVHVGGGLGVLWLAGWLEAALCPEACSPGVSARALSLLRLQDMVFLAFSCLGWWLPCSRLKVHLHVVFLPSHLVEGHFGIPGASGSSSMISCENPSLNSICENSFSEQGHTPTFQELANGQITLGTSI